MARLQQSYTLVVLFAAAIHSVFSQDVQSTISPTLTPLTTTPEPTNYFPSIQQSFQDCSGRCNSTTGCVGVTIYQFQASDKDAPPIYWCRIGLADSPDDLHIGKVVRKALLRDKLPKALKSVFPKSQQRGGKRKIKRGIDTDHVSSDGFSNFAEPADEEVSTNEEAPGTSTSGQTTVTSPNGTVQVTDQAASSLMQNPFVQATVQRTVPNFIAKPDSSQGTNILNATLLRLPTVSNELPPESLKTPAPPQGTEIKNAASLTPDQENVQGTLVKNTDSLSPNQENVQGTLVKPAESLAPNPEDVQGTLVKNTTALNPDRENVLGTVVKNAILWSPDRDSSRPTVIKNAAFVNPDQDNVQEPIAPKVTAQPESTEPSTTAASPSTDIPSSSSPIPEPLETTTLSFPISSAVTQAPLESPLPESTPNPPETNPDLRVAVTDSSAFQPAETTVLPSSSTTQAAPALPPVLSSVAVTTSGDEVKIDVRPASSSAPQISETPLITSHPETSTSPSSPATEELSTVATITTTESFINISAPVNSVPTAEPPLPDLLTSPPLTETETSTELPTASSPLKPDVEKIEEDPMTIVVVAPSKVLTLVQGNNIAVEVMNEPIDNCSVQETEDSMLPDTPSNQKRIKLLKSAIAALEFTLKKLEQERPLESVQVLLASRCKKGSDNNSSSLLQGTPSPTVRITPQAPIPSGSVRIGLSPESLPQTETTASEDCQFFDTERFKTEILTAAYSRLNNEPTLMVFVNGSVCVGTFGKSGKKGVRTISSLFPDFPWGQDQFVASLYYNETLFMFDSREDQSVWSFSYDPTSRLFRVNPGGLSPAREFIQRVCQIPDIPRSFRVRAAGQASTAYPSCFLFNEKRQAIYTADPGQEAESIATAISKVADTEFLTHIESVFSWLDSPSLSSVYAFGSNDELYQIFRDSRRKSWNTSSFTMVPYETFPY